LTQVLAEVDILLINETEARALSGERNLLKAYRKIRTLGPRILVVKRGEYGAMVLTEEGAIAVPALLLEEVVDPTGAGDTFAGGFLGTLAASGKLDLEAFRRAVITGSVMASLTVQDFGLRGLEVATEQDIKGRTQAFSDMIRTGGL